MSSANIIRPIRPAPRCRSCTPTIEGIEDRAAVARRLSVRAAVPVVCGTRRGLFFLATAYLLGREYFELAAMRFHPVDEAKALRRANGGTVFVAGLFIAAFVSIPIVNLATPLFGVAFMVHMHKRLAGGPRRELLEPARSGRATIRN